MSSIRGMAACGRHIQSRQIASHHRITPSQLRFLGTGTALSIEAARMQTVKALAAESGTATTTEAPPKKKAIRKKKAAPSIATTTSSDTSSVESDARTSAALAGRIAAELAVRTPALQRNGSVEFGPVDNTPGHLFALTSLLAKLTADLASEGKALLVMPSGPEGAGTIKFVLALEDAQPMQARHILTTTHACAHVPWG